MSAIPAPFDTSSSIELAYEGFSHAAPLSPLRARDLQAMVELFQMKEIEAIEHDILQNLILRCPEPYWEDLAFGFLKEYL
jgi:hypothetical protein